VEVISWPQIWEKYIFYLKMWNPINLCYGWKKLVCPGSASRLSDAECLVIKREVSRCAVDPYKGYIMLCGAIEMWWRYCVAVYQMWRAYWFPLLYYTLYPIARFASTTAFMRDDQNITIQKQTQFALSLVQTLLLYAFVILMIYYNKGKKIVKNKYKFWIFFIIIKWNQSLKLLICFIN
jgi:hypothetical protein